MDVFKQNRYLSIIIILLVILNLATLTMLWLDRPSALQPEANRRRPAEDPNRVERILKDELGFNNEQTGKFLQLRRDQQEKVRMLNQKIHETKKQMFDEVLQDNPHPTLSDSLLNITQEKQAQIEKLTYNYFLELKKLCNPQQRKKLQVLMHEVFAPRPSGNEPGRRPLPPPNGQSPPGPPPERK